MATISWPASVLLVVLVLCTSALTYKGIVPVHALLTVAGLIVGYLLPKGAGPAPITSSASSREQKSEEVFAQNEVPTRPGSHGAESPRKEENK